MKKAQISGQVLIFVLALIVTAAVLLFGYRAIKSIGDQQAKLELVKFQNNLKQNIEDAAYSYGSSKRVSLIMPKGYDELCLIDKNLKPGDISEPDLFSNSPVICESWMDENSQDNAFLLKTGSALPESFYAGNLSVDGNGDGVEDDRAFGDQGFLCIKPTRSTISFILEGRGRRALVRK
jgi:hypothetical protein